METFQKFDTKWLKAVPHLLFANREVLKEATGFFPFEHVHGKQIRGPLDMLKEAWEGADDVRHAEHSRPTS